MRILVRNVWDTINTWDAGDECMPSLEASLLAFIVALIISTLIIYAITKLFGETEGISTAVLAAIIGTVIYSLAYYLFDQGLIAALIGGIVWLLALQHLYEIGWLRSLGIAIVVWIAASVVGIFLPTVAGPF
jgi:hypothetical protein